MSKSLRHVLNYNENKVKEKTANCIGAEGFGMGPEHLSFDQKVERFASLTRRNRRSETNIAHITLSFAPGETLSEERLLRIAQAYMDKVGFGNQPYLVYEHLDTNHPHIHIVSTNIQATGVRIPTHMIGARASSKAREEIEKEFNLVRAADRGRSYYKGIPPLDLQQYLASGKKGKAAVSAIVRAVIAKYRFTSLSEYNAILQQFGVIADPGTEGSLLQKRGGLLYSAVDGKGAKVGAQIKSSAIYVPGWSGLPDNAGLKLLEAKFRSDRYHRRNLRDGVLAKVEQALATGVTLGELTTALRRHAVVLITRYNVRGVLSGVMFVDHEAGVAFKGSELKKSLGAAGLASRLLTVDKIKRKLLAQICEECFSRTQFKAGFPAVLKQWEQMGLTLEARVHQDGVTHFWLGADHAVPGAMIPAPARIDRYLRVNLAAGDQRARRRLWDAENTHDAAMLAAIHALSDQGHLRLSLIEELVHAEEPYNELPTELLKEARKKKRRKRSR